MPDQAEQRMDALEVANDSRSTRAKLKRDLKAGEVRARDILLKPIPKTLRTMKVITLLEAVPGLGRTKATMILRHARVPPESQLGNLSRRERAGLLRAARDRFPNLAL
jgi:hypothetical protein